jgi:hypothetical protein
MKNKPSRDWSFFSLIIVALCVGLSRADDPPATPATDQDEALRREFAQWAAKAASSYDIRRTDAPDVALTLHEEPVLKWSNPERGKIYGHVFVWTSDGRPQAVASLYKWYHPFTHSSHEFQSLSSGKLVAQREGSVVWTPVRGGVELRELPDAPPVGDTSAERLRQARSLAHHFRADERYREGERTPLRTLTQPIYRYDATDSLVLGGALFAFVQGTDPEALLLLEARTGEDGKASWHYALARLNRTSMRVFYDDRELWTAPELTPMVVRDPSEPYFVVQFP